MQVDAAAELNAWFEMFDAESVDSSTAVAENASGDHVCRTPRKRHSIAGSVHGSDTEPDDDDVAHARRKTQPVWEFPDLFSLEALASSPNSVITPRAVALPSALAPDYGEIDWSNLKLIVDFDHHKTNSAGERIVSDLKNLKIKVRLVHSVTGEIVTGNTRVGVRVTLQYEGGDPVQTSKNKQELLGDTEVVLMQGVGTLTVKIQALSALHKRKRFQVHVEPVNPSLRLHKSLSVNSEPFRSVTKLERGGSTAGLAKAEQTDAMTRLRAENDELRAENDELRKNLESVWGIQAALGSMEEKISYLSNTNKAVLSELEAFRSRMATQTSRSVEAYSTDSDALAVDGPQGEA